MRIVSKGEVKYLVFDLFEKEPVTAAVSARIGGVSTGSFQTFNMGFSVGDREEDVAENRRRFFAAIGVKASQLVSCRQVHGTHMERVTKKDCGRGALRFDTAVEDCDGLYTNEKNVPLTLNFADCTPLLFYDPVTRSAAVAHGGWRGTAGNIAGVAIRHLQEAFGAKPADILAAIGPAISKECFEVGGEVIEVFGKLFSESEMERLSEEKENRKYIFDLPAANRLLMIRAGVLPENIEDCQICTWKRNDLFYSYRKEKGKTGRHMAVMILR